MQTILWGSMGPDSHNVDTSLESAVGKRQSLPHLAIAWAYGRKVDGTPNYAPFPGQDSGPYSFVQKAFLSGQTVMLDVGSWDLYNQSDPAFSLDAILTGMHDDYLHSFARSAAQWAHPVMVRLNWEMQGGWFPWGNQPATYVAVWRKIVAIFRAEGATNVTWCWCANAVSPVGQAGNLAADKLAQFYPGDDVVDWTGVDCYNEGYHKATLDSTGKLINGWITPWMTMSQILAGNPIPRIAPFSWFGSTYDVIKAIAPTKPISICEFNTDDRGGDKARWWADALTVIPRQFPLVRAISIFNWNSDTNAHWALSFPSLTSVAAGLASPVYLAAGDWTPPAAQPFGAPAISVGPVASIPAQLQQRGSTWDAVASSLSTDLNAAQAQVTTLQRLVDDTKQALVAKQKAISGYVSALSNLQAESK